MGSPRGVLPWPFSRRGPQHQETVLEKSARTRTRNRAPGRAAETSAYQAGRSNPSKVEVASATAPPITPMRAGKSERGKLETKTEKATGGNNHSDLEPMIHRSE